MKEIKFFISSNEYELLRQIKVGWQKIFVQNGIIIGSENNDQFISITSLYIRLNKDIWITVIDHELENEEYYKLGVFGVNLPDIISNLKITPPIKELYKYPKYLNLDAFSKGNNNVSVIRKEMTLSCENSKCNVIYDDAILIENENNKVTLLITTDKKIPLNLEICASKDLIKEYMQDCKEVLIL